MIKESRTQLSLENMTYGFINTIVLSLLPFITRTIFIKTLGKNYLGIDSIFLNIIVLLDMVNVGIGTAIVYSAYKPIADNNIEKIKSLFRLYLRAYQLMALIVSLVGLLLLPFLDILLKNKPNISENLYVIYLLFLLSSVIGYLFAQKHSIIIAHQKTYIITRYRTFVVIVVNILEIIFLLITKEYLIYLLLQISQNIILGLFVWHKATKLYPYIKDKNVKQLDKVTKKEIIKNTGAMLFYRVGELVSNGTSSILISTFVGVIYVGYYSNYFVIKNMVVAFAGLFIGSLTASIGNLYATETPNRLIQLFDKIFFVNFWIFSVSSICLYNLFNPFISLWIGNNYLLDDWSVLIIVSLFYFIGLQKPVQQYKTACGVFWKDRFRPLIEAMSNILFSILFVKFLGLKGVFLGALLSFIAITLWFEPYVLYKTIFQKQVRIYYIKYFYYSLITIGTGISISFLNKFFFSSNTWYSFGSQLIFTILLANAILILFFYKSNILKETILMITNIVKKKVFI